MILGRMKAAVLAAVLPLAAMAQQDAREVYVFGNSLVHHLGDAAHSNAPYWMDQLARADGRRLALDGQWGFLRDFAGTLPPQPNWTIPGVTSNWDPGRGTFGDAGYDAVVITPANFIQDQDPGQPFAYDNPEGVTPVETILTVMDWVEGHAPGTPVWIYEGWSDMDSVAGGFPPSRRGLRRYHDYNTGAYGVWYDDLVAELAEARPEADLRLIPVARVLSGLLQQGGLLEDLPVEALYVDGSPHGTPALYFLAGAVSYAALFNAPPPESYTPPVDLTPEIAARWPQIAGAIWQQLRELGTVTERDATAPAPVRQAEADPLPARGEVALPGPGAVPQGVPALAMGLYGLSDWSTQQPFIDVMKTARDWVGHLPGQWGGVSAEELRAGGHLDADGWPQSLPPQVERIEALLLTDQPEAAAHLRGSYRVTWQGRGEIELTGRARRVRMGEGEASFDYEPGEGSVGISIAAVDAADPVRDIHVIRADLLPLHEVGALFNPDWLARIRDLRSLRFMDWMMTNGSPVQGWDDRPRLTDHTWTVWGAPLEVMIALANEVGADPWFTLPHMADDDYIRRFAETVKAGLDPRLKAHVEYSNEVWNHIFPQAGWAAAQAETLWGASESGWIQFYGLRAAQVMDIWTEVYGSEAPDRLVRVVATHTGWPGLEEQILTAPLAFLHLGHAPVDSFDAYAVTGYFGYEMGGEEMAARIDDWLSRAEAQAERDGAAQGLQRVALREYVRQHRFDAAILPVAMALQEGSLGQLVDEVLPYQGEVAQKAGLRLVMYEGGTHVAAQMARVDEERLTEFFQVFNYTPEMAKLYEQLLTGWVAAGGTLFNAFVDVAPASKWGSWGALRYLEDSNPRWDMLMAYNASAPTDWDPRGAEAFAQGLLLRAGARGEVLEGTELADTLIGGPGNDDLRAGGGDDRLHGGDGTDRALLRGLPGDYEFRRDGTRLIVEGPAGQVTLVSVESLRFSDDPDTELPTAGL